MRERNLRGPLKPRVILSPLPAILFVKLLVNVNTRMASATANVHVRHAQRLQLPQPQRRLPLLPRPQPGKEHPVAVEPINPSNKSAFIMLRRLKIKSSIAVFVLREAACLKLFQLLQIVSFDTCESF